MMLASTMSKPRGFWYLREFTIFYTFFLQRTGVSEMISENLSAKIHMSPAGVCSCHFSVGQDSGVSFRSECAYVVSIYREFRQVGRRMLVENFRWCSCNFLLMQIRLYLRENI